MNGTQVIDDLPVSSRVTDNTQATTAYLAVNAEAGRDVVVLLKAETRGQAKSRNVHINGFEIDTPNPKAQAHRPFPVHADEHVDVADGHQVMQQFIREYAVLSQGSPHSSAHAAPPLVDRSASRKTTMERAASS